MEEMTSKEIGAKIRSLKSEISQLKLSYSSQINPLKQRIRQLSQSPIVVGALSSKLAEKRNYKLKEITKEVERLEKERNNKILPLEKELEKTQQYYRDNYDKLKEHDKKARANRLKDLKIYAETHKTRVLFCAAGIFVAFIWVVSTIVYALGVASPQDFIGLTVNEATLLAEKVGLQSDVWGYYYDPDARDEQRVDYVSALYHEDGSQDYDYDKYMDISKRLLRGSKISFEVTKPSSKQQADIDSCNNSGGNPKYKIEQGKVVCYQEKTQEEKKAECEAIGNWYRDGQCKSQEEWENQYKWADAHAACKKYGSSGYAKTLTDCYVGDQYMGPTSGESSNEASTQTKQATEDAQKTQSSTSADDPTKMPEDELSTAIVVCKRAIKQAHGIDVKTTEYARSFWYGEDYVWLISFMYGKDYTAVTCRYNWKTGRAVSDYINW